MSGKVIHPAHGPSDLDSCLKYLDLDPPRSRRPWQGDGHRQGPDALEIWLFQSGITRSGAAVFKPRVCAGIRAHAGIRTRVRTGVRIRIRTRIRTGVRTRIRIRTRIRHPTSIDTRARVQRNRPIKKSN
jgi:hypothetical protein